MQITGLDLTNWLAHRHLTARFERMTVIAGPNAAGKSSIADAIAFVLLGAARRVEGKGDRPQLISDGAERGTVLLHVGDITIQRDVATGKMKASKGLPLDGTVKDAIPYLLTTTAFAKASADDRRVLLLRVMQIDLTPAGIRRTLAERGHATDIIEGLPADGTVEQMCTHAERQASEWRGSWRAHTGEAYGPVKAETWAAQEPETAPAPGALAAAKQALEHITATLADLQREQGALDAGRAARARYDELVAGLRVRVGGLDAVRIEARAAADHLAKATASLVAAEDALAPPAARAPSRSEERGGTPAARCPTCGGVIASAARAPAPAQPAAPAPADDALRQARAIHTAATLRSQTAERALADAEGAQATLDSIIQEPAPSAARAGLDDEVQRDIADALRRQTEAQTKVQEITAAEAKVRKAAQLTHLAARAHAQVKAWIKMADDLSPSGIPNELLTKGLGGFNDTLAWIGAETHWRPVLIGEDMAITAGGRPYGLLSESEQWRVDASIVVALALHSDVRFIVLDRLDVLEPGARSGALAWVHGLVAREEIDTALVLGTMAKPPQVPAGVGSIWLGPKQTEEAA